ncbi:g7948 [Coccomyxa viridis]|uniref:G7948 protein n=1 Tax=Coccomyxa viridis TaxID=1274662 RepID=A0ABP1G5W4_9CHLO
MAGSSSEVMSIYRALLRCGSKFPNYNVREYVLRRTKQDFRAHREDADASGFLSEAKDALEIVKRQAVVYSTYARKHKSIMDIPLTQVLRDQADIPAGSLKAPGME